MSDDSGGFFGIGNTALPLGDQLEDLIPYNDDQANDKNDETFGGMDDIAGAGDFDFGGDDPLEQEKADYQKQHHLEGNALPADSIASALDTVMFQNDMSNTIASMARLMDDFDGQQPVDSAYTQQPVDTYVQPKLEGASIFGGGPAWGSGMLITPSQLEQATLDIGGKSTLDIWSTIPDAPDVYVPPAVNPPQSKLPLPTPQEIKPQEPKVQPTASAPKKKQMLTLEELEGQLQGIAAQQLPVAAAQKPKEQSQAQQAQQLHNDKEQLHRQNQQEKQQEPAATTPVATTSVAATTTTQESTQAAPRQDEEKEDKPVVQNSKQRRKERRKEAKNEPTAQKPNESNEPQAAAKTDTKARQASNNAKNRRTNARSANNSNSHNSSHYNNKNRNMNNQRQPAAGGTVQNMGNAMAQMQELEEKKKVHRQQAYHFQVLAQQLHSQLLNQGPLPADAPAEKIAARNKAQQEMETHHQSMQRHVMIIQNLTQQQHFAQQRFYEQRLQAGAAPSGEVRAFLTQQAGDAQQTINGLTLQAKTMQEQMQGMSRTFKDLLPKEGEEASEEAQKQLVTLQFNQQALARQFDIINRQRQQGIQHLKSIHSRLRALDAPPKNTKGPTGGDRNLQEYCNLMTHSEKQWLIKIQLKQLQTQNPYLDDYYYQNYIHRRQNGQGQTSMMQQVLPGAQPHGLHSVPGTFRPNIPEAEKSLGHVIAPNVRTPKQLITMDATTPVTLTPSSDEEKSRLEKQRRSRSKVLKTIEDVYKIILDCDDISKQIVNLPPPARGPMSAQKAQLVVRALQLLQIPPPGPAEDSQLEKFAQVLGINKGRKAIARLVYHCSLNDVAALLHAFVRTMSRVSVKEADQAALAESTALAFLQTLDHLPPPIVFSCLEWLHHVVEHDAAFALNKVTTSVFFSAVRASSRVAMQMPPPPANALPPWVVLVDALAQAVQSHLVTGIKNNQLECWELVALLVTTGSSIRASWKNLFGPMLPAADDGKQQMTSGMHQFKKIVGL